MKFANQITKWWSGGDGGSVRRTHEEVVVLHWGILLSAFFAILIFVFASGYFIFRNIESGGFSSVGIKAGAEDQRVTTALLEKTVSYFETKRVTFDQVLNGRVRFGDPSL